MRKHDAPDGDCRREPTVARDLLPSLQRSRSRLSDGLVNRGLGCRAALGGSLGAFGLGESKLHARNVRDRRVIALARLGAENFLRTMPDFGQSPLPAGRSGRARSGSAPVVVFENFDAQAIRRVDVGLIEAAVVCGLHRHARRLPLRRLLLHVVDDETDVVDRQPPARAVGRWRAGRCVRMIMTPGNTTR
jgi:hypothetical protein